jgi:uncharacterized membrane protein YdjX (TVP38/TMEM64 family)
MRRLLLIAVAMLGVAVLLALNPGWLTVIWKAFSADSIRDVAAYLRGFGIWAPLVSTLLMVLQAVIAPLPGSLVAAANGIIFGIWWGTLLSWVGSILGGTVSFYLARWAGRDVVTRLLSGKRLERANQLSEKQGFWIVLTARLIPLISLDWISYLAGLSRMRYTHFLLATAIGMLPGMFAWTAIGHDLALAQTSIWRLSLIGLLMVGTYLVGRWWMRRNREQWKLET